MTYSSLTQRPVPAHRSLSDVFIGYRAEQLASASSPLRGGGHARVTDLGSQDVGSKNVKGLGLPLRVLACFGVYPTSQMG